MVGIGIDIGTLFFFFLLLLMESLDDGMDQVYDGHAGHVEAFVFLRKSMQDGSALSFWHPLQL